VHQVNGLTDFSNIITNKGLWAAKPKILKGTYRFYDHIPENKFLKMLRDLEIAGSQLKLCYPSDYHKELILFYNKNGENNRNQYKGFPIRLCPTCIKEHVAKTGYGIMKIDWLQGDFCVQHNTPLFLYKSTNRTQSIHLLKKVYRGHFPEFLIPIKANNTQDDYYKTRWELYNKEYNAGCLQNSLKSYISKDWNELSSPTLKEFNTYPDSFKKLFKHQLAKNPKNIDNRYRTLFEERSNNSFNHFLHEITEINTVLFGTEQIKTIKEVVHKNKNSCCAACKINDCIIKHSYRLI